MDQIAENTAIKYVLLVPLRLETRKLSLRVDCLEGRKLSIREVLEKKYANLFQLCWHRLWGLKLAWYEIGPQCRLEVRFRDYTNHDISKGLLKLTAPSSLTQAFLPVRPAELPSGREFYRHLERYGWSRVFQH